MALQKRRVPCLIQVNTGGEPQKAGIFPQELKKFLDFCQKECCLPIKGLMCIPPVNESPTLHFAFLKTLAAQNNLKELSMGMSGDYKVALAHGATYIRIGTGFFGERL
jgi:hypothetical protein